MASTINALSTGSGGLITTGDASGQLELQANGSTKLTVSSSGVNIAGGITSPLIVTGNSTAGAELRLPEDTDNGSNYVALKAADSIASNVTFTLPSADGTSGQVIQTNGSGTLSFVTPAGGSWTYLSSVTASNSATVDVETTFSSTYDMYAIVVTGFRSQNDGVDLRGRYKISGSYATANYQTFAMYANSSTQTFSGSNGTGAFELVINVGFGTDKNCNLVLYLSSPSSTSLSKVLMGQGAAITNSGHASQNLISGFNTSTSAVEGFRFYFSAGNIVSGTARLYGIKNS